MNGANKKHAGEYRDEPPVKGAVEPVLEASHPRVECLRRFRLVKESAGMTVHDDWKRRYGAGEAREKLLREYAPGLLRMLERPVVHFADGLSHS